MRDESKSDLTARIEALRAKVLATRIGESDELLRQQLKELAAKKAVLNERIERLLGMTTP
ncbi:hypothetical protein [Longimicrobium terrae]|uniref:Uncharacterized protein involved in exopolysaccharide biosynthesis n=1 Tax=Longimicrobium terrae TaxID=1639882 RepID=A0A841GXM6_9BACT|nr:hypothetical protein [Longimicrobium terrae]MBB4636102.1 uncharacterized protein involved in exopolysaccharide biosynthesis [Longimicrobium terrae]MBB6070497.1 uncharacterized protein involved in exopolysaccharide biosynthesis [Longimicrobium terrae]NNC29487.1 hypothetical protein [Longimicrobium terrae]